MSTAMRRALDELSFQRAGSHRQEPQPIFVSSARRHPPAAPRALAAIAAVLAAAAGIAALALGRGAVGAALLLSAAAVAALGLRRR